MGMLLSYHEGYAGEAEAEPEADPGTPGPPADAYDELTDEQVAEAYATNVGGNATSRKGQTKVLRALDAKAAQGE